MLRQGKTCKLDNGGNPAPSRAPCGAMQMTAEACGTGVIKGRTGWWPTGLHGSPAEQCDGLICFPNATLIQLLR